MSDHYPDLGGYRVDDDPFAHHCEIKCGRCGNFVSNRVFPEHECFDPGSELAEFLSTPEGKFARYLAGR